MLQTYKDIQGWFDYENIYDNQVALLKDGSIIVEIGCWLGKSSCYLAQKIKESMFMAAPFSMIFGMSLKGLIFILRPQSRLV